MTPEKQRIIIAELMGYKDIRMSSDWEVTDYPDDKCVLMGTLGGTKSELPDYLNDLNAMHKVENTLIGDFEITRCRYVQTLENIVRPDNGWSWALINATAEQKAEAYLKTKNKYE